MRLLAIESATSRLSAAVWENGAVRTEAADEGARAQAARLPPLVAAVLAAAGVAARDLDAVAVGTGPGSFTGLRAGLALATGIAEAAGLPIVGVTLAEVFRALWVPRPGHLFWVAIDQQRGRIFLDTGSGFAACAAADLPRPAGPVILAGNAAAALAAQLAAAGHAAAVADLLAGAAGVAQAAAAHLAAGDISAALPLPLYVDPPALGPAPGERR